jgi:hypothetical protein
MIIRVLMLLLALIVLVNLCIITGCAVSGENLYQKYGKQLLYISGAFVFFVAALYVALALIGLK